MDSSTLFVVNIVLVVIGIILLVVFVNYVWDSFKSGNISEWPRTLATITYAEAKPANDAAGSDYLDPADLPTSTDTSARYQLMVKYSYTVAGRSYTSDKLVYNESSTYSAQQAREMLGGLERGTRVRAFYNTSDPSEAYLYAGETSWTASIISGIALLLVVGAAFYFNGRAVTKSSNSSSDTIDIGNDYGNYAEDFQVGGGCRTFSRLH